MKPLDNRCTSRRIKTMSLERVAAMKRRRPRNINCVTAFVSHERGWTKIDLKDDNEFNFGIEWTAWISDRLMKPHFFHYQTSLSWFSRSTRQAPILLKISSGWWCVMSQVAEGGVTENIFERKVLKVSSQIFLFPRKCSTQPTTPKLPHHPRYSLETIFTSQHKISELNKKKTPRKREIYFWSSHLVIFIILISRVWRFLFRTHWIGISICGSARKFHKSLRRKFNKLLWSRKFLSFSGEKKGRHEFSK